jgi:hypothetical protein
VRHRATGHTAGGSAETLRTRSKPQVGRRNAGANHFIAKTGSIRNIARSFGQAPGVISDCGQQFRRRFICGERELDWFRASEAAAQHRR